MVGRSILKRLNCVGSAVVLMLAMVPIIPNGGAWADESSCISSEKPNYLNNAVSSSAEEVELTLCAGGSFEEYPYGISPNATSKFILRLNGNSLRLSTFTVKSGVSVYIEGGTILHNGADQLFRNDGSGTLTLENVNYAANDSAALVRMNSGSTGKTYIKGGNYSNTGSLFSNKSGGSASIEISDGIFNQDVNAYTAAGRAAYKNGNVWQIETKLTNENIAAPDTIVLKEGEVFDVARVIGLPVDSTTGFGYYSRNNDVASINYHGVNSEGSNGLLGVSVGTTSIAVRPLYDTSLIKNINVTVESGLAGININDTEMTQEDEKSLPITNIYHFDRASGVTYEVVSVSDDKLEAGIVGNTLKLNTGDNGKIEPGTYTVTVVALVNGERTNITKDVTVTVNALFTDFNLAQVGNNGLIVLKETQQWVGLNISSAATVSSINNVKINSVSLLSGDNVMRVSGKRISGNLSGVGMGQIAVEAEYTSPKGNKYILTKNFSVKVESALEGMTIRGADLTTLFTKYGRDEGETGEVTIDKNDTRRFTIVKDGIGAAVDYVVTSDDEAVEITSINQLTGSFTVKGVKKGAATITVTVTPKNAINGEGAFTNSFTVNVNPILESITARDLEIDQVDTGQIEATANDGLTPNYIYRETTQGEKILNINRDGSFTVKDGKHGEATVEIIAFDARGRSTRTTINIKVNAVLTSITLADDEITVYEGETKQIEVASIEDESIRDQVRWHYENYDRSVIRVSRTGEITPLRDGETEVTVRVAFNSPLGRRYVASAQVKVIAKSKLESIAVEDINVKVGEKADINITVEADDITPRYTYEYSDSSIARNSRTGGVRALKAGDTELTVTAKHFGKTVTATAMVHVYEMEQPTHHHYYGATGHVFNVHVGDKNTNAYTRASVDAPWGMFVMGDNAVAFLPGVYTVTYTDYMANGKKVGEYTAEFTIFNVERETVVVARGETVKLEGHSEWSTTTATDETTGHHIRVNRAGKAVFATDESTALGVHNVVLKHMFRIDAREVVKEVTVVVYDVTADPKSDPAGVTGDTLREYIEGMFDNSGSFADWMARMSQTRELFGDGFESVWSVMGLNRAVMSGSEISTRVDVTKLDDEKVEESLIDAVEAFGVDGVEYYDISVWMASNGVDLGKLHQLNNKITVALAKVTDPETGYTRQYIVVRQHEGEEPEVLVEGVDFYIEDGVLHVISDKFSTFAIAYEDTQIPVVHTIVAPETGANTADESGATASLSVATMVAIAVVTMAGVAIFTKRK